MSSKNAIEKSIYLNERYKEFLSSSFHFGNENLQSLFEKQIDQSVLFKGPFVDLNLPFKRGKNIEELIQEGVVSKYFKKLNNINFTRPLYSHQEKAIRQIKKNRGAIITTGTGSGKTESFVYPILNDILYDIENGHNEVGVRAIFLYPMNALVNDQIERIREILRNCPEITFGFFTGDTKENEANNFREKYFEKYNIVIPDNELVSRKEIRENPPHLLFTNYSMLEYLLIRPNDYSIISDESLKNWEYVVLDEAHTYNGSLGIELSLLMRRLTGLVDHKPKFILTSATLGEQGKSEQDIVTFGKNLTSYDFDIKDIIFSERIPLNKNKCQYQVEGEIYSSIKKSLKNVEEVKKIISPYSKSTSNNINEILYDFLEEDRNVHAIYDCLKNSCKDFDHLYQWVKSISKDQLIDLIDLINMAEKNGIGLFDLKYHSFIRPISGAYATLGENPKLSLVKTNEIDNKKAFELGNCKYCNSPYIIGKICNFQGLDYLIQNGEVDIYENYGDNEAYKLDYFLLENSVNEEEVDAKSLVEYKVCTKCGCIHMSSNLNAVHCGCGDEYQLSIYKVENSKSKKGKDHVVLYNNINQCPCCGHRARAGVVKSLNLGKDEGTALVSQILLEALDKTEASSNRKKKISLKRSNKNENKEEKEYVKQFLAFSDSRQQASFSAAFLDANQTRILRKRLIWKVIEDQNYRSMSVDELTAYLADMIKRKDLFDNDLSNQKNAWVTMLTDLLKIDGDNDGEGLGLYYFDLDLDEIIDELDDDDVEDEFGEYNINKNDIKTLMQVIFSIFKTIPAIYYVKSTLTQEEKDEYLEYRRFDNYVALSLSKYENGVRSLMPLKQSENSIIRYIKKITGCDSERAREILEMIFNNLAVETELLKKHETKECYQIDASKFVIKNYKNSKYYRCSKCGKLTPYNIHNKCVRDKCDGTLEEADPDVILKNNFYREQYKTKKIEKIVVKEHTAQLERQQAKQYQKDFKDKKINILSCSTTFEMGVDIGDLETVFMRNIPPTPANYVQRAGRAGRRKDSAAYILTYCGVGSHDYTYFCEPEKMIAGVINPPKFEVLNKKIIVRHLMAACLGYFFRNNPELFKSINGLVFGNGYELFKDYILSQPQTLNDYINKRILPEKEYKNYHDFKWFDEMDGNDEKMLFFIDSIRDLEKEFEEAKEEATLAENFNQAEYYKRQIERLHKENVISSLSKYSVIPKYGFPVDVVDLQIYKDGNRVNKYDLSRDLRIAIAEYAPDSEIIVDGKKYTSKYITLPKSGEHRKHYFSQCPNCKRINVLNTAHTTHECRYCKTTIESSELNYFIKPTYGFKTGTSKETTTMKPKRSYAGEISYLGGGIFDDYKVNLNDELLVETSSNDELLVMNKSDFYMCKTCGYTDLVKSNVKPPVMVKEHKNFRQFTCENREIEKLSIGHTFQTDIAKITIPLLTAVTNKDYAIALSFLYAFLEGVSAALDIERNDINGVLNINLELSSYDVIIFDNVPGGAGHVKRLANEKAIKNALHEALQKVSHTCCDENTSCYNCLRNYYNQSVHSKLKRKYAKDFIEQLIRALNAK